MNKQAILNNVALILDAVESETKNAQMSFMVTLYPDKPVYNIWHNQKMIFRSEMTVDCKHIIGHNIFIQQEIEKQTAELKDKIKNLESQVI